VVALINNNKVGEGKGRTKRQAEMQAAKMALRLFGLLEK
jgi:dsRNA-specific ribonuclease